MEKSRIQEIERIHREIDESKASDSQRKNDLKLGDKIKGRVTINPDKILLNKNPKQ